MMLNYPKLSGDSKLEVCCTLEEYEIKKAAEDRKFYLSKTISSLDEEDSANDHLSTVSYIVKSIIEINKEDKGIDAKNRKQIIIYINSPGGELTEGFLACLGN